ncbi:hypothetical protein CW732_16420 [Olleya sp. Bg11-27]|nr:hypothetical protein CW732_16420 [Olleya sp. Bg11-27]
MSSMLKQIKYFSILYFLLLLVDIYTKINMPDIPYRYITKTIVLGGLLVFTRYYCYDKNKKTSNYLYYGLILFFIGDILIIDHTNTIRFVVSMILFVAGKVCYTLKFKHKEDFSIKRLMPFFIVCFLFLAIVYDFIYHNLNLYFIPVTLYFFISLIMILFAFIRKGAVNNKSYYIVFAGVGVFLFSETTMVIKTFYGDVLYQDFLIMFCYALGQYLIIIGVLFENKKLRENSVIL